MKTSKIHLINAILFFAKAFGKEKSFKVVIKQAPLPKVIEMIVYQMFLNDYTNPRYFSQDAYNHYTVIFDYAKELDKNGFVNFEK